MQLIPSGRSKYQQPQHCRIVNMGRLRNLSASFKAAAFSNSSTLSVPSLSKTSANGHTQIVDRDYASPTRFEDSPTPTESPRTTPRTDRIVSRPTSMVYTPPSMDFDRENHIEELRPVFRCAECWTLYIWILVLTPSLVSYQARATSSIKKVLVIYWHTRAGRC